MSVVNFENIDNKLKTVVSTDEWKLLEKEFGACQNVIVFGHGGNMAVSDHGGIDIARLTDKTTYCPSSNVVCTSMISDFGYLDWIKNWLEMLFRTLKKEDTIVIGTSCSVGTNSSMAILNGLNYSTELGFKTFLISARYKSESVHKDIVPIVTNSIYYHTSEVLTLMLLYQLIFSYTNGVKPPPIKVVGDAKTFTDINCSNCDNGSLDHSFCVADGVETTINRQVPPGFEADLKNLAIDFDNTIMVFDKGFHDGTCYGEPLPGALESLEKLSKTYNLIIYSAKCRPDRPLVDGLTGKEHIVQWLQKYNVMKYVKDITHEKPRAQFYIDDKAIVYNNNWDDICSKLL